MVGKFEAGAAIRSISPDESWFQARRGALGRGTANGYRSHSFTEGVAEPIFTRTLVTRPGRPLAGSDHGGPDHD